MSAFPLIAGWGIFFWSMKQGSDALAARASKKQMDAMGPSSVYGPDPENTIARSTAANIVNHANYEDMGYTRDDYVEAGDTLADNVDPSLYSDRGWVMNEAEVVRSSDAYRQGAIGAEHLDPFFREDRPAQRKHPLTPKFYDLW